MIAEKLSRLKNKIPGCREVKGFEYGFGATREEQNGITRLSAACERILAEIEFAAQLSADRGGEFDECINDALDSLLLAVKSEGVVTNSAAYAAEQLIMPIKDVAKEYKLILAAHAHIDMNWMWSWNETVAITLATFQTMLDLMDEYPDFCYSQSQASVYKIVEDFDPDMMERIKARIAEGRWECTATNWVETDKNMPSTESLLRHIKYTRSYLEKHWGIDPQTLEVDFSPDTFGHSENIPEIDSYGNVKYYYHCRGDNRKTALYRWRAPSGREIMVYREQFWYNSGITPQIAFCLPDIVRRQGGLKTGLIVYGIGDHGGGPTRRDVEKAIAMQSWPVWPVITFGTFRQFFKEAESVRDKLEVIEGELNFIFDGCYTTQSRIKRGNRMNENALVDAMSLAAVSNTLTGSRYQGEKLRDAWVNVLFTHFHDILTGSCVQDTREHAMGLYQEANAAATVSTQNAMYAIAANIDTSAIKTDLEDRIYVDSLSEGGGAGYGYLSFKGVPNPERGVGKTRVYHIFNTLPETRTEQVELTIWDWPGDTRRMTVEDVDGNPVEFILPNASPGGYWSHQFLKPIVNVTLPPLGYTTVVVREKAMETVPIYLHNTHNRLDYNNAYIIENEYIRAEFDMQTCSIISLIDRETGAELLNGQGGLYLVDSEMNGMTAWAIGKYMAEHKVENITRRNMYIWGGMRQGVAFDASIRGSTIHCDVSLSKGSRSLQVKLNITWNEASGEFLPLLIYRIPLAYNPTSCLCDVPAGAVKRSCDAHDIPALQYCAAINPHGKSIALMADCKYGYRCHNNNLIATLINTARNPDPFPERGIHDITLNITVADADPRLLKSISDKFNRSPIAIPVNPHKGCLPTELSFLSMNDCGAVISSVELLSDGAFAVRVHDVAGEGADIVLNFARDVKSACLIDLMENVVGKAAVDGGKVSFRLAPHSIAGVKLTF